MQLVHMEQTQPDFPQLVVSPFEICCYLRKFLWVEGILCCLSSKFLI